MGGEAQEDEELIELDDMEEIVMDEDERPDFSSDDDMDAEGLADEVVAEMEAEDAMMQEEDLDEIVDEAELVFSGHADPVYDIAYHPTNPDMAATAGGDDVGAVWDLSNATRLHTLSGHTDTVNLVAFSNDGMFLATGSLDGTVRVWGVASGAFEEVNVLQGPGEDILWLAWHPKGNVLLAGSADSTCWMWSVPKGKEMQCFVGHAGAVLCGGFTPDGKMVATASEDGTMRVWNPKSGASKMSFKQSGGMLFHDAAVTCMDIAGDSKSIATGSEDHTVALSNVVSGKVLHRFEGHEDGVEAVAICANMPFVASASLDGTVRIWDIPSQSERLVSQHRAGVVTLRWHPTLPIFFSGSIDRTVQAVDARDGKQLQLFTGHRETVLQIQLSPSGDTLMSGSDDNTARLFRLSPAVTGKSA